MSHRSPVRLRVLVPVLLILVILNVALIARLVWPIYYPGVQSTPAAPQPEATVAAQIVAPTASPTQVPSLDPDASVEEGLNQQGAIILAMQDGAHSHLFAYNPRFLPLTPPDRWRMGRCYPRRQPGWHPRSLRLAPVWLLGYLDARPQRGQSHPADQHARL
jgi:hypothetical protein